MEIPTPDPPLAEGDVVLRPWRVDDAPVLAEAWADPAIRRWCAVPEDAALEGAERWIAGSAQCRADGLALDLAIVYDGHVAGEVGLGPIQWAHRRAASASGWTPTTVATTSAAKALRLLAPWALSELPLDTLAGEASAENPASGWTLKAAGFTLITERDTRQAWIREA